MTSFFEQQDRAQSKTGWLIVLFLFGAIGVIASLALLAAVFVPQQIPLAIGIGVLLVGIPFLFKLLTMSSSGALVAESLGGTRIDPGSREASERKILNVVEEMAIASGMPIPPVYVLDEECINAFAAGKTPQDAVIGVSRGAIESLSRDELQGVMAHEFSHIFHGDMRINMRAIAAIFGIMAVGYIGYFLLRSTLYAPRGRRSDGKTVAAIAAFSIGLIVIGCIGTFFGRLMQAAISRQREFLADASAVQYTRNPAGIGGALRKIGAQSSGTLRNAAASQFNHMFFAEGMKTLFASHPPLAQRIARIEAMAGGVLPDATPQQVSSVQQGHTEPAAQHKDVGVGSLVSSIAAIGTIPAGTLARVRSSYAQCGDTVHDAAHNAQGAQAIIFAVLAATDHAQSNQQRALIAARMPTMEPLIGALEPHTQKLSVQQRIAIVDVACATLVCGTRESYLVFRDTLSDFVRVDGTINLLEWVVLQILLVRVELPIAVRQGLLVPQSKASHRSVAAATGRTLGILALQGTNNEQDARRALQVGLSIAGLPALELPPTNERTLDSIAVDLDVLANLRPADAGRLISAASACVMADQVTTDREYLLLRALSERLSVPLPTTM